MSDIAIMKPAIDELMEAIASEMNRWTGASLEPEITETNKEIKISYSFQFEGVDYARLETLGLPKQVMADCALYEKWQGATWLTECFRNEPDVLNYDANKVKEICDLYDNAVKDKDWSKLDKAYNQAWTFRGRIQEAAENDNIQAIKANDAIDDAFCDAADTENAFLTIKFDNISKTGEKGETLLSSIEIEFEPCLFMENGRIVVETSHDVMPETEDEAREIIESLVDKAFPNIGHVFTQTGPQP